MKTPLIKKTSRLDHGQDMHRLARHQGNEALSRAGAECNGVEERFPEDDGSRRYKFQCDGISNLHMFRPKEGLSVSTIDDTDFSVSSIMGTVDEIFTSFSSDMEESCPPLARRKGSVSHPCPSEHLINGKIKQKGVVRLNLLAPECPEPLDAPYDEAMGLVGRKTRSMPVHLNNRRTKKSCKNSGILRSSSANWRDRHVPSRSVSFTLPSDTSTHSILSSSSSSSFDGSEQGCTEEYSEINLHFQLVYKDCHRFLCDAI